MIFTDQNTDTGFAHLRVLADTYPELTKVAGSANLDTHYINELDSSSFAWPEKRAYPIHNREHTALSLAYATKIANEHKVPADVLHTLYKAAEVHKLDLTVLLEEPKVQTKVAAAEYILPELQRFRVASAEDVQPVEQALHTKLAQLRPEQQHEAGMNLVQKADTFGVEVSPATLKLAGLTVTHIPTLRSWVDAREELSIKLGSPVDGAYHQMSLGLGTMPDLLTDREDQLKIASLLVDLDSQAGVDTQYGRHLQAPLGAVFNTDTPTIHMHKIGSAWSDTTKLQALPLSFWKDVLGDDIADDITNDGEVDVAMLQQVLNTLPDDIKATVTSKLSSI